MPTIKILPGVKSYNNQGEKVYFKKLSIEGELTDFEKRILNTFTDLHSSNKIRFIQTATLSGEAYEINVYKYDVECLYATPEGRHNAVCTLKQLLQNMEKLETCSIYDEPQFKIRSVMIDISRNKVPKLETLKNIAYHLSLLKINDIQLYIEGRAFYYAFLDKYYDNKEDYLLPEEMLELYHYCQDIGVTLTPNTNCFGHMAYWLNQDDLNHLALKPEGFEFTKQGLWGYAQTIDPDNEEAVEFVIKLLDELLVCFPGCQRMTIGGDEPFEILYPTKNPNAKDIYLKHMTKIINHIKSKGITPSIWADVVKDYPDTLHQLKDTILLEWGYDAGDITQKNCEMYQKSQIKYMVCPGTSGWLTFTGRMNNMIQNYKDAANHGGFNGAIGMVITDWNDGGSFSQLPTNLLTYAYGACYAWGENDFSEEDLNKYLDEMIFKTKLAASVYDLGNYYLCQDEELRNATKLFISFFSCQTDGINIDIKSYSDCNALSNNKNVLNYEEIEKTQNYLKSWYERNHLVDNNLYRKELMFSYRLVKHSLKLNYVYLKLMDVKPCIKELRYLQKDIKILIREYHDIWYYRNKKSDYSFSEKRLKMLEFKYNNLLKLMSI